MKISKGIHRLCLHFSVVEGVERFVYLYLLVGKKVHIIDAGIDGCQRDIKEYLEGLGFSLQDVGTLLLTHTHPDHIGAAFALNQLSGCTVIGPEQERAWVENVNQQHKDRPVPNFFTLVKHSIILQTMLQGGETLQLEPGITIQVLNTKGHSPGSLSYYWVEEQAVFCGDAIPCPDHVPVFDHAADSLDALETLRQLDNAVWYLPAWDGPYDREKAQQIITGALARIYGIQEAAKKAMSGLLGKRGDALCKAVASQLGMPQYAEHPLFRRSIAAVEREMKAKEEK